MQVLLQYQSKSYYIIGQEVYYSIGRFYYIIRQLLHYRAFLLHYRARITVSGVYYIIGWYRCRVRPDQRNAATVRVEQEPRTVTHVKRAKMFDPMG